MYTSFTHPYSPRICTGALSFDPQRPTHAVEAATHFLNWWQSWRLLISVGGHVAIIAADAAAAAAAAVTAAATVAATAVVVVLVAAATR